MGETPPPYVPPMADEPQGDQPVEPTEKPKPTENFAPSLKPGWYRLSNIQYFADSANDEVQNITSPSTMTVFRSQNFSLDGFSDSGMPIRPWQEVKLEGNQVVLEMEAEEGKPPKRLSFNAEWFQDPPF